jgi:two-component system, sensor histidine kinase and response regulator
VDTVEAANMLAQGKRSSVKTHDSFAAVEAEKAEKAEKAEAVTVLLIDDDPIFSRAITRRLAHHRFETIEAVGLAHARQLLKTCVPSLILVDLQLPDGHGFELVRELKTANPSRPVLVLSGTVDPADRIASFGAGADDFIAKPVDLDELVKRLEVHDRVARTTAALQRALAEVDHMRLHAAEAVALLAHDLNNGLCVAVGNLAFLAESEAVMTDAESTSAIAATQQALRRMTTLVKNFVDIARSEDGALKPALTKCDVHEILRNAASVHHQRGANRSIDVECEGAISAFIDPTLVERVLHNLLINATRYVNAGGRINLSARRSGAELLIEVGNTGPAIPEVMRARLFEKYRKGDDRKAQSGMGLYFCRLACEAHGGTISLDERPGFATCFVIRLPVQPTSGSDIRGDAERMRFSTPVPGPVVSPTRRVGSI